MALADEATKALQKLLSGARASDLETATLDFKRQKAGSVDDTMRDLAEAAMCFANSQGGVIVVGVDDKASGAAALVGTTLEPLDVQRRIHQLTKPPLLIQPEERFEEQHRVLLLLVPESPEIHADPKGRATHRVKTDCEPMGPGDYERIQERKSGVDWSSKRSERPTSAVAPEAMITARSALAILPDDRKKLSKLSERDLLTALGVVSPDGSVLLRAGELMFCQPAAGQASEPVIVYQYRATPGGDPRDVQRLDMPLVRAAQRAIELVTGRRIMTPITLPNGQQLEIADFPEAAIREALINALVHRNYSRKGPVVIEHSPEVLVITSPGPLVAGVTLENILTHPSTPRNPALAKAMRTLGYAEEVGRGVDRIYREMIRAGRAPPRFEAASDHVRVTLVGGAPNSQIAKFIAELPEDEQDDTDTLLVVFLLCAQKTITAENLAPVLQKNRDEAEATLRRLASDRVGLLEPTRQSIRLARPTYRLRNESLKALGQAVSYQRRTIDDTDRKIVAHVREYGKITNRTVQNLFDVGMTRARAILKDLVLRQWLVKESQHERGPGVEYGPGPRFPASARGRRKG